MPSWSWPLITTQGVTDSLAAAALFGIFITGISTVGRWLWVWRDKLRFSLDGTYLGIFEDEEKDLSNGEIRRVYRTGMAKLKQRGTKVSILHSLDKANSWSLNGDLLDRRHLAGIYKANDEFNTGVGSFYLMIEGDRMAGAWTGYDHKNGKITTGEYEFRKMIQLRPSFKADKRHWPQIRAVATSVFGPGYFKDIQQELKDGEKNFVIAVRHKNDDAVIGFAAGYILPENELTKLLGGLPVSLNSELKAQDVDGTIGVLKSIAVLKEYHGRGVGYGLFLEAQNRLKALGANSVVVPAWKSRSKFNLNGILEKFGYSLLYTNPTYWASGCDAKEFICPERTEKGCHCQAVFYSKIVSSR